MLAKQRYRLKNYTKNKDALKLLNELIELETQLQQDAAQGELLAQATIIRKIDGLGLEKDKIEEILKSKLDGSEDDEKNYSNS